MGQITQDAGFPINFTATGLLKEGSGAVAGLLINSHTSGTFRLLDGRKATLVTRATATLTSDATNVTDGDTFVLGSITYRFKDTLAQAYDIKIGASAAATLDNVKAAVNASGTDGTEYYAGTYAHPEVIATTNTDTTQLFVARTAVAAIGNAIVTTEASTHLSFGGATMAGGVDGSDALGNTFTLAAGSQVVTFPRPISFKNGLYVIVGGTLDASAVLQ